MGNRSHGCELNAKNVTRPPHSGMHHSMPSFKSDFKFGGADGSLQTVRVPFSSFSVDWSDFTGECGGKDPDGTQHYLDRSGQ